MPPVPRKRNEGGRPPLPVKPLQLAYHLRHHGLSLGLPFAVLVLLLSLLTGCSVAYGGLEEVGVAGFSARMVLFLVQTVIPEELIFRGGLIAVWARSLGMRGAHVASAVPFGL
jgi:membrane protease YdiL (CAAX protease family)